MLTNFLVGVILLTISLFLFRETNAQLRCYSCNSYNQWNGSLCINPMDPRVPTIICPRNYVCSRVTYVAQRTFITSRHCDPSSNTCNNIRGQLQSMYPDLSNFKCSTCSRDYCNSGTHLTAFSSLIVGIYVYVKFM